MSEAPTPETDAFAKAMYSTGVDCHHDGREALKHAERLERERDEAIAARKASAADWLGQIEQANLRVSRALRQVALAERERDEAREQVENQKARIGEFFAALEKLTSERDEAREDAQRKRVELNHLWQANEMAEQAFRERDEAREYVDRYRERLDLTPMSWEAAE